MYDYQISVALNGQFMFRTEWDDDSIRVGSSAVALATSMPLASVRIIRRDKLRTEVSAEELLR